MATGLFVGLITLDLIYLTTTLPDRNQKIVAQNYLVTPGGPATNAAIAFQYFSNSAKLMGVLGSHPLSQLALAELQQWQLALLDLEPNRVDPLPTSSILVTAMTGERAVISINATRSVAKVEQIPVQALEGAEIVLIDGHQMAVGAAIAQQAQAAQIPVVVDAGSWKPGFETVLAQSDYVICSDNFRPPGCSDSNDVIAYLQALHVPHIAISRGAEAILGVSEEQMREIAVPAITAVDTLGAGDILHGCFCDLILRQDFLTALTAAAQTASRSCQFFGPRAWMDNFKLELKENL